MGLFGTDGVRGLANAELTPELALAIASAAARVLVARDISRRPRAVVGYDPRHSSEMLEAAVVAGLTSAGVDVIRLGVLPTPAVAYLTATYEADLGVVLSASHNPMPDNGVKLFAAGGVKLPDGVEAAIEAELAQGAQMRPTGADIGRISAVVAPEEKYLTHLLRAVPTPLAGLNVVLDCANGAASIIGPELFRRAGATVRSIAAVPDGININDGVGSTHLAGVSAEVLRVGAELGFALDGDADRCLAVDATGTVVDGDQILALCALALHDSGRLAGDAVVATVMSNLGFHKAMRAAGIEVITTSVGDRYVLEALHEKGLSLGGEQSGHVIFTEAATTGDGLLTALSVAARVVQTQRPLSELAGVVKRLPQVLQNVPVINKAEIAASAKVAAAVSDAEAELGEQGRVLLRPSGTENLVRVMVEAPTATLAESIAERIALVVTSV